MKRLVGIDLLGLRKSRRVQNAHLAFYNELKQSSRKLYLKFYKAVILFGFMMLAKDYRVYVKRSYKSFVLIFFYVDTYYWLN